MTLMSGLVETRPEQAQAARRPSLEDWLIRHAWRLVALTSVAAWSIAIALWMLL